MRMPVKNIYNQTYHLLFFIVTLTFLLRPCDTRSSTAVRTRTHRSLQQDDEASSSSQDLPTSSLIILITFIVIGLGTSCLAVGLILEYHCRQGRRQQHLAFVEAVAKVETDIQVHAGSSTGKNKSLSDSSDVENECHTQAQLNSNGQSRMVQDSPTDGPYGAIYYENGHRRGVIFDLHFDKCRDEALPDSNHGWIISGHARQHVATALAKGTFQGHLIAQGRVACNGDAYWILMEQEENRKNTCNTRFRGRRKQILVRASFDSSRPRNMIGGVWHAHGPNTVVHGRFSSITFLRNHYRHQQQDDDTVNMDDADECPADFDF